MSDKARLADRRPAPGPVLWTNLPSPVVGSLLGSSPSEVGLLPVGATEQHGPHLPTGTDTIVATAIAEAVSAKTAAPVLPPVSVACSYGHGTLLPGTLSLSTESLSSTIREVVEWAAYSGLRRVIVVNGHLGNVAALGTVSDHLRHHRPDLRIAVMNWWDASPRVREEVRSDGTDIHANRAETSIMLAIAPHLVQMELAAQADDPDRTGDLIFRYTAASLSRNGVTGRPAEATHEIGAMLFDQAVTALCEMVQRGRRETPPLTAHRPTAQPLT